MTESDYRRFLEMWSSWEAMFPATILLLWKKMKLDLNTQLAVLTTPISPCFFHTQKLHWNLYLHLYLKISVLFNLASTFSAFSPLDLPNSTVRQAKYEFGSPVEREIKQGSRKLSAPQWHMCGQNPDRPIPSMCNFLLSYIPSFFLSNNHLLYGS